MLFQAKTTSERRLLGAHKEAVVLKCYEFIDIVYKVWGSKSVYGLENIFGELYINNERSSKL